MPLSFPFTPHQWLRVAQLLACLTAALSSVALGRAGGSQRGLRMLVSIVAFFAAAFVTRYLLRETESRLQMAAFAAAAALLERIRSATHRERFSFWRWVVHASAAAVGVLLAKHFIEPGAISVFVLGLFDGASSAWPPAPLPDH